MLAVIGFILSATVAIWVTFWGTYLLTGNITMAMWAPVALAFAILLVYIGCNVADSGWMARRKHRHIQPIEAPRPLVGITHEEVLRRYQDSLKADGRFLKKLLG